MSYTKAIAEALKFIRDRILLLLIIW